MRGACERSDQMRAFAIEPIYDLIRPSLGTRGWKPRSSFTYDSMLLLETTRSRSVEQRSFEGFSWRDEIGLDAHWATRGHRRVNTTCRERPRVSQSILRAAN